jgi:hypothetical protein
VGPIAISGKTELPDKPKISGSRPRKRQNRDLDDCDDRRRRHNPQFATMSKSTTVTKASDASVPVDPEQTLKACKALVAHIKKSAAQPRDDGKQNLLADEESTVAETPVWLTLTTKKHIHDSHRMFKHCNLAAAVAALLFTRAFSAPALSALVPAWSIC